MFAEGNPLARVADGLRVLAYGYRIGEVTLPKIPPIKKGAKVVRNRRRGDSSLRIPSMVSTGVHLVGAAMPHPDCQDASTLMAGVKKRFLTRPPKADKQLLRNLKAFTRRWCKANLTPLPPDTDTSVDTWLGSTNYPLWRKVDLAAKWSKVQTIWDRTKKYFRCKLFCKDETYPDFKHARGINSRSDEFKCKVGPIFAKISEKVFAHKSFIKNIPVKDRPKYIMNMLYREGAVYYATDYTAFESLFTREIMEAVEFVMYDYMTQYLPEHAEFMRLCHRVLGGKNVCENKNFTVEVPATRMSGEMCTSLGNGFSNLMFLLFVCEVEGIKDVAAVVEGDDGLFTCRSGSPTEQMFTRLGLNIKLERHSRINTASFCGIIFDPEDRINVTDPREAVVSLGWTFTRYSRAKSSKLKALLRCKALSMLHQYPGCPIISAYADYGLRVTRSVDIRHILEKDRSMSQWDRDQLLAAIRDEKHIKHAEPGMNTRLLVEDKYGITVEHQIMIERAIKAKNDLSPVHDPILMLYISPSWQSYYANYVDSVDLRTDFCRPAKQWPVASAAAA